MVIWQSPFAQDLLGDTELLHKRYVGRTDIGAATALETLTEVVVRAHQIVFALGRQHAELRRVEAHRAAFDAFGALDAGVGF